MVVMLKQGVPSQTGMIYPGTPPRSFYVGGVRSQSRVEARLFRGRYTFPSGRGEGMGVEALGLEQPVLLRVPPPQAAEPHARREAPASPVDEAVEHRLRNSRSGSVEPGQARGPAQSITNDAGALG